MSMSGLKILILAAGKGKRMKSELPKVLHTVCGVPMVQYVLWAAEKLGGQKPLVVVGYKGETVTAALGDQADYVYQKEQLGTGHAVKIASRSLEGFCGDLLVLYGDTPLISVATLEKLMAAHREKKAAATLLSVEVADPTGYGRVVRDKDNRVAAIVEESEVTPGEKLITEVNTGIYCFRFPDLTEVIPDLQANNAQGEYYLTDVVALLRRKGLAVEAVKSNDPTEILGPNDRKALAETERIMQAKIINHWLEEGVTFVDPAVAYVDPRVKLSPDTTIYPGTLLYGKTSIGGNCRLGPYTQIIESEIGNGCHISFSVVNQARIGDNVDVGPYAHIRPGTVVESRVRVGNFVEIKNSRIGADSRASHLSYIGDSLVGTKVNIGAGTITCNFDGRTKHRTIIKDGAFIGSNTSLVAPVVVGENSLTGAGSTITKDVPDRALGIARARQVIKENWTRRQRKD